MHQCHAMADLSPCQAQGDKIIFKWAMQLAQDQGDGYHLDGFEND
jgi:hypothetical protein